MQESTTQQSGTPSEFVPDPGGSGTADANVLMVAAYLIFWLLLTAFIALGWRRQQRIDDRLAKLERAVQDEGASDGS